MENSSSKEQIPEKYDSEASVKNFDTNSNSKELISKITLMQLGGNSPKPFFETSRHSWVFKKAPPAPEALTSVVSTTLHYSVTEKKSNEINREKILEQAPRQVRKSSSASLRALAITGTSNVTAERVSNTQAKTPTNNNNDDRYFLPTINTSGLTSPLSTEGFNDKNLNSPNTTEGVISPTDSAVMSPPLSISPTSNHSTIGPLKPLHYPSLLDPNRLNPRLPKNNNINSSQRTSVASSSNRDSFGSDAGYFSTSPNSEYNANKSNYAFQSILTNISSPLIANNQTKSPSEDSLKIYCHPNPYQPIASSFSGSFDISNGLDTEDGFFTARSSLYLTPHTYSPNSSIHELNTNFINSTVFKPSNLSTTTVVINSSNEESTTILSESPTETNLKLSSSPPQHTIQPDQPNFKSTSQDTDSKRNSTEPSKSTDSQRRLNIALEILNTERTYVAGLELIEKVFYKPLHQAAAQQKMGNTPPPTPSSPLAPHNFDSPTSTPIPTSTVPVLTSKQLNSIFANLMGILNVNREFLRQLEDRLELGPIDPSIGNRTKWSPDSDLIGDIFCQMAPYFRMYSLYVKNFNTALSVISDVISKSPSFASFLKEDHVLKECKGLPFESYLILPVQRIPRYKLLIEDLLKKTLPEHPDHSNLEQGLDIVLKVATFVNETIRQHEMFMEMLNIQNSLVGFNEVLLVPGRRLIKKGSLHKICRKNHQIREFFLFTDLLIYASGGSKTDSPLQFHRKVDLEVSKVLEVEDTDIVQHSFQIINPDKSFQVYCDTLKEKEAWIDTIQKTIDELLSSRRTLKLAAAHPPRLTAAVVLPQVIPNYQAPVWIPDDQAVDCNVCKEEFTVFRRKHHCRLCGNVVCHACSNNTFYIPGTSVSDHRPARACDTCYREKFGTNVPNNHGFNNLKRYSLIGSAASPNISDNSNSPLARFPFNAPRRLAELRESFLSRDSFCSEITANNDNDQSFNNNRPNTKWFDPSLTETPGSVSSTLSGLTKFQRLRSVSGSTAALMSGLHSGIKCCQLCLAEFTVFKWKFQCQICHKIVCGDCLSKKPFNKRLSIMQTAPPTLTNASCNSSLFDTSLDQFEDSTATSEDSSVCCDPCNLGIDPAQVEVNPEGGGWGVHERQPYDSTLKQNEHSMTSIPASLHSKRTTTSTLVGLTDSSINLSESPKQTRFDIKDTLTVEK